MEAERRMEASEIWPTIGSKEREDNKTAEETSRGDGRVEPMKREQQWLCEASMTLDQLAHRRRGS